MSSENLYIGQPAPTVQSMAVLAALKSAGVPAKFLARAPMLEREMEVGGWKVRPWEQERCALPALAWKQIVALNEIGIRPDGYVIWHEPKAKPTRLPSTHRRREQVKTSCAQAWSLAKQIGRVGAPALVAVLKTLITIVGMLLVVAGAVAIGAFGLVAWAVANDPVLVAVVAADDGGDPFWFEIARWYEE